MSRTCEHCGSDTYFARNFPRVRDDVDAIAAATGVPALALHARADQIRAARAAARQTRADAERRRADLIESAVEPAFSPQEAGAPQISDEQRLAKICRDHEECAEDGCDRGVLAAALASRSVEVFRLTVALEDARRALASREAEVRRLQGLADWLISLDDPPGSPGAEERRTVTLTQIIDRAAAVVANWGGSLPDEEVDSPV